LIGESQPMREVCQVIRLVGARRATVLITGETGAGKELAARALHMAGPRRHGPFVAVNCGAIPENLIESILFGHEKGSFTGADQQRKGRFDLAEGGTLYLDDVDDIPWEQQPKLLRAIEEKVFERVGGTSPIKADVRIIASTKRNLLAQIAEGTFRQDLYYRLDVLRINIPPLSERLEDLPDALSLMQLPHPVVFFDGSHRCLPASDVTIFFLEILPRLRSGTIVHIHDIFLPADYPPAAFGRYWSEQYLLAAYLLGGAKGLEVMLPGAYLSTHSDARPLIAAALGPESAAAGGSSFWLRKTSPPLC